MSRPSRSVLAATVILCITTATTGETPRNRLPKQQHKRSDAPFLQPEEAVAKMAIPDGFEVSDLCLPSRTSRNRSPSASTTGDACGSQRISTIRLDDNIRMIPVSRIQILEDTDGDGVFDKKKTFTDTLTFTSGLACGFRRCLCWDLLRTYRSFQMLMEMTNSDGPPRNICWTDLGIQRSP